MEDSNRERRHTVVLNKRERERTHLSADWLALTSASPAAGKQPAAASSPSAASANTIVVEKDVLEFMLLTADILM